MELKPNKHNLIGRDCIVSWLHISHSQNTCSTCGMNCSSVKKQSYNQHDSKIQSKSNLRARSLQLKLQSVSVCQLWENEVRSSVFVVFIIQNSKCLTWVLWCRAGRQMTSQPELHLHWSQPAGQSRFFLRLRWRRLWDRLCDESHP